MNTDGERMDFTGLAIPVNQLDSDTGEVKGEVILNVAMDVDTNMVFIAITAVPEGGYDPDKPIENRVGLDNGDTRIKGIFELALTDWAAFNAALQRDVKKQITERLGLPSNISARDAYEFITMRRVGRG